MDINVSICYNACHVDEIYCNNRDLAKNWNP